MRLQGTFVLAAVGLALAGGDGLGLAARGATLAPVSSFGGGDGWRAPFEVLAGDAAGTDSIQAGFYNYLGNEITNPAVNAGNLERGLAYNAATGHLILVSRNTSGGSIRILDATTGVDLGALNYGGVPAGGTFLTNMVGVADDGAIYVGNLSTNATTSPFKIYRWASETAAAPTVAYDGTVPPLAGARIGDTLDVIGGGVNTRMVAGFGNNPAVSGNNSFALFTTADGLNYTSTAIAIATNPPEPGDFRLGITFTDNDTVIGKQGANTLGQEQFARQVDVAGATGTLSLNIGSDGASLRPLDFAVVNGRPLLAMLEASPAQDELGRSRIFVYDMTNPEAPVAERKIAEGSNLPFTPGGPNQFRNLNGVGSIKFGPIEGNMAIIYAMSSNNGIQAFQLTLEGSGGGDADFDGDGDVDGADFLTWQQNFGAVDATPSTGDADGDSQVTGTDLNVWNTQFDGGVATTVAAIPEPATAALAGLAVCALLLRRRL
ncbi:MAG: DUF4623 domain-containing protein [Pirellulales bacterium]|nr:DUF4623 domain-containing protein [Pirellulales bacterium]